ncbi:unnamed protein product, partial [Effrenium voratum]
GASGACGLQGHPLLPKAQPGQPQGGGAEHPRGGGGAGRRSGLHEFKPRHYDAQLVQRRVDRHSLQHHLERRFRRTESLVANGPRVDRDCGEDSHAPRPLWL